MELLYGLIAGGTTGLVAGFLLATRIHTIADTAAQKAITVVAASVGGTATLAQAPPVTPTK